MPTWPNAEFWRLWGALVLGFASLVLAALLLAAPRAEAAPMRASFYGAESGRFNADGSRFNPMGLTAASRTLPFGVQLRACFRACVVVTVRDRGPAPWTGRALDLSRGAARVIGLEAVGIGTVDVEVVGRGRAPRRAYHRRHHHR